ncbi:PQQ-binding-like beta-propeller repeat protein [Streptomyces ficellus]|uniref:Serine/threonine protein kinase n=1 Tax=Streptomyces ficellus TaxID=1977088 RepID=A0A6I6F3I6_9ACTN|nr:PQQ-binding-like beta-propeller repeat protein [Streptomyces ficellus]QGV78583.1 serine/threonine protein kinase [Streptomyces ficellus]
MDPSSPLQPIAPLGDGDPRRCGAYTVLARLAGSASAVRYLGRDGDGTPVLLTVAPAALAELAAFRRRFATEARTAERLAGGRVPEMLAAALDRPPLWTATPYVPALTLGEAVALAGPLLARTVRVLGAGLAETLSRAHTTGTVLHGLAPGTVLLAADGPRLTAFGPLGAAESASAGPAGRLSVRLGYLTPEQVAGHEPGPPSDVFVLGLLLAYAATGTPPLADAAAIADAEPVLGAVPRELRPLIARCLAKSPEDRPTAGEAAAALAPEDASPPAPDGWLPDPLRAALDDRAGQVAALLETGSAGQDPRADLDGRTVRVGRQGRRDAGTTEPAVARPREAADVRGVLLPPAPPVRAQAAPAPALPVPFPSPPAPAPPRGAGTSRRGLFTGLAAGVTGAVLGGGGVLAFAPGGGEERRTDAKPAARPRPAVAGVPPRPRWAYEHPAGAGTTLNAAVWRDRTLVLTSDAHTTAVDLATGRRLWQRAEAASAHPAVAVGNGPLLVVGADGFRLLSPEDGTVRGRVTPTGGLRPAAVAGQSGTVVWFTGTAASRTYLVAYDVARSEELWRIQVPNGRPPFPAAYEVLALRPDALVVRQDPRSLTAAQVKAAKGLALFSSHDRATGARQWFRPFGGAVPGGAVAGDGSGRLYAAVAGGLQAFDTRTRRPLWRLAGGSGFGRAQVRGGTLYVADRSQTVYAVDAATGRARWRRVTEAAAGGDLPDVTVGGNGRTLLAADGAQVTAFAAGDGRRLWKFQDAGVREPGGRETPAGYGVLAAGAAGVVVRRDRTFYGLPVE